MTTETPTPSNVVAALAAVSRDLPAIGKDGKADPKQGGYAYRGIEQITQETQRLFAKYEVVFVPRVVSYEIREIEVNSKPWTDTVELVEYDIYGPGGVEDKITVGPILAIGRDNSDKGGNKCLTQAFKYALLQTLCISDAKDDADGVHHEADQRRPPPAPKRPLLHPDAVARFVAACEEAGVHPEQIVEVATEGRTMNPAEVYADEAAALREAKAAAVGAGVAA